MYIECCKNNGTEYLRLVESRRRTNDDGKRVSGKRVVFNIGPLSRYDDGQPDYVGRLKQSFIDGEPLIGSLMPYVVRGSVPEIFHLDFVSGSEQCIGHPKYYAGSLLDSIFSELGLNALFTSVKHNEKISYDLCGLARLMVFGRLLDPASKYSTFFQNDMYFKPLTDETDIYRIYDVLDLIHENRDRIIRRMNASIRRDRGSDNDVIFYDVTNFFFETEDPDDDTQADGETVTGTRQMGVSKENRKQPIVQMGLFLDSSGIPISIEMFPGNTLDQQTLRPALKKNIDKLGFPRFVLIADRGLCSGKNTLHLRSEGNGYIVSKGLKSPKTGRSEREWALSDEGLISLGSDFKYKSRIVERTAEDETGQKHTFKEKVVVYWSRSFWERERHENERFLKFIDQLKENPASFRVTQSQSKSIRRFLKKEVVDKTSGEILDPGKLLTMIDEEKLSEFNELMGYYQLVTSELDMDPLEVIDKYHGLTRIEDQFRVMKGTLDTRPIYVRTREHIEAHLIICLIALTMMRLLQTKIVETEMPPGNDGQKKRYWTYGLSANRIQAALKRWTIEELPDDYYRFCDVDDPDLHRILKAIDSIPEKKLYTRGELRSMKSAMKLMV